MDCVVSEIGGNLHLLALLEQLVPLPINRFVWVLEGDTGKVLHGWPVKLPGEVRASVLLTKLIPGESTAPDIVSI